MFNAKLINAVAGTTRGQTYQVVDFNDYSGHYVILNDAGERTALNWMRFADQGRASTEYQRAR